MERNGEVSPELAQQIKPISKNQGVSFKLADMAKLFVSEILARVTDEVVQIFGGMGLMNESPFECLWEGTSEIQCHIISKEVLRVYKK